MSIYEQLVARVSNGEKFHIDFEKRNMKVGKDFLIKEGKYDETQELLGMNFTNVHCLKDLFLELETLYKGYKYSLPSERSDSKRKKYFKALPIEEIPDRYLWLAERREIAQAILEGFVLCMILTGKLVWDEDVMNGKWFYQSKFDPDLIVLRKWVEGK